jgi:hypothetical protein
MEYATASVHTHPMLDLLLQPYFGLRPLPALTSAEFAIRIGNQSVQ